MLPFDNQAFLSALKAKIPNARVKNGALSADEKITALENHKHYDHSGYKFVRSRLNNEIKK